MQEPTILCGYIPRNDTWKVIEKGGGFQGPSAAESTEYAAVEAPFSSLRPVKEYAPGDDKRRRDLVVPGRRKMALEMRCLI